MFIVKEVVVGGDRVMLLFAFECHVSRVVGLRVVCFRVCFLWCLFLCYLTCSCVSCCVLFNVDVVVLHVVYCLLCVGCCVYVSCIALMFVCAC